MKKRTLVHAALAAALAAATVVGCAAISGLDQLEEQTCAPNCGDASIDADAGHDTADTAPDTTVTPDTGADAADASDAADAGDAADAQDAADAADAQDAADAADAADTAPVDAGDSGCGPLNTITNCTKCGATCDSTNSNGRVCDVSGCQYSGCKAGWADCSSASPNADGCETSTTTLANCGGCGNVCDTANSNGRSCDGASCNYTGCKTGFADCNKTAAPNTDGCETNINTSPLNCTACGVKCDTAHSFTPSCNGTSCVYGSCAVGYSDCDKTAPNSNGCECATPACCGNGCAVAHKNCMPGSGFACGTTGQNYFTADACQAVGTPGTPGTYSLAMATAARAAWPVSGTDGTGVCSGAHAVSRSTPTACVLWLWDTSLAGGVYINTTPSDAGPPDCLCFASLTTTWN